MIKYVKFTNERKNKYQISTSLIEKNNKTFVIKRAMNKNAIAHIKAISENYKILSKIYNANCVAGLTQLDDTAVQMEYIEGKTLQELMEAALNAHDLQKFYSLMDFYKDKILKLNEKSQDENFIADVHGEKRRYNIDLTFDNIIINSDGFTIIDYEWLVSSADKKFILYRAINNFFGRASNNSFEELKMKILEQMKLDEKDYIKKEIIFVNEVLNYSLDRYKKTIENIFARIERLKQEQSAVIQQMEGEKRHILAQLENSNKNLHNVNEELRSIHESRGYRLVKKYYRLRDVALPRNSLRRIFVKNAVKILFNCRSIKPYIKKANLQKLFALLCKGSIRQLLVKIDDKLSRNNLLQENISKVKYLNYLFQEKAVLNMDNMTADIVIPIYNAYDFTVRCIELVYKNTDVNYNLYLINDCSTDVRIGAFLDDLAKKERPRLLKKLLIINNEENMGFIKSVNKALRNTENHVVLLNTDTEVPPEWLKRLLYPLVEDEMTATVTPFSNSATICSYPNFCEDNALPTGFSSSSLDAVFKKYGGQAFIEIPTGVGFCMAMRKQLIKEIGGFDTIYGKGYGEENDWCRHAVKNGYRNVMVTDLFVYHKHGVSFNEQKEKKRQDRINENLQILNERYPDYGRRVNDFIASDPLRIVRDFIKIICKARQNTAKEGILFINHSLGGGATVYQEKIIAQWQKEKRIYKIELLADFKTLRLTQYDNTEKEDFYFDFEKLDEAVFSEIIKALEINSLYINQLVNYPPEKIIRLIKAAGLPYTFFIHDFYAVCPEYNLLNEKSIYCGAETDLKKCRDCLARQKNLICKDISLWRQNFKGLLLGAQEVLAPSNSAADIVNKYYPEVEIGVREHTVADWVRPTFEKKFWQMDIFNIAVLGAIGENKGSKIVYELARLLKKKNIPAKITVIGFTDLQNEALIDERLEITGRYDNRAVSELLAKHHIALVLIPSICPETYSYTAGEAVGSGYPLMTFDIGAPAERIRRDKCGWIIEKCSAEAVLEKLENILANKEKYLEEFLHE